MTYTASRVEAYRLIADLVEVEGTATEADLTRILDGQPTKPKRDKAGRFLPSAPNLDRADNLLFDLEIAVTAIDKRAEEFGGRRALIGIELQKATEQIRDVMGKWAA